MNQSLLKIVVPVVAVAVGAIFVLSVLRTNAPAPTSPPATAPSSATTAPVAAVNAKPPATTEHTATIPAATEAATAPATQQAATPATQPAAVAGLHAEQVVVDADPKKLVTSLGSDDKGSQFKMKAEFIPYGSGIREITLTDYMTEAMGHEHYVLVLPMQAGPYTLFPFAAVSVSINGGKPIDIQNVPWRLVPSTSPNDVTYRLQILDGHDKPVLRITRTYSLDKDSYDLRCAQHLENLSGESLRVVWEQNGQGDVPVDNGFDQRMLVAGYFNLSYNPTRTHVYTDKTYLSRVTVLNALADKGTPFWPNPGVDPTTAPELAWFATANRYFTAVTHPIVHPPANPGAEWTPDSWFNPQTGEFAALGTMVIGDRNSNPTLDTRRLIFTLTSRPLTLPAGSATNLDMALYAGPLDDKVFEKPSLNAMDFDKLIVFSRSCTFCTFQSVAWSLLWFLKGFHFIFRDWGVSIIVLVLLVRLVLHPITKRSQISMTKMGKQMQTLQPEIEKLKKKYKDDQSTLNSETMKLYKEKGVNPANMLGCLPMVLQMPIWVALYAMLYGAIQLRQQPAFYGIFQAISGGHWAFLADLSSADNFIRFHGEGFKFMLPLLNKQFTITGINLLPILMAVVYFYQQKLMTPPAASEQAAQQQKMMKWMILLFPIMLYSYPSGLNLYILASTAGGIVDSLIVKRHIKREEEAGTLFAPVGGKKNKPGGWRERLQESLESKQRAIEERQRREGPKRSRDK